MGTSFRVAGDSNAGPQPPQAITGGLQRSLRSLYQPLPCGPSHPASSCYYLIAGNVALFKVRRTAPDVLRLPRGVLPPSLYVLPWSVCALAGLSWGVRALARARPCHAACGPASSLVGWVAVRSFRRRQSGSRCQRPEPLGVSLLRSGVWRLIGDRVQRFGLASV